MSFLLADSHSYPGRNILTKRFSQWHTRNIPALNNTAQWHWDIQGTAWQPDFYKILARSLRDLCEIGILQGKAAGQSGRDPFYSSLLCSRPLFSLLLFNSVLFSTLLYIYIQSLLLYSSLLSSVWVKLLRSHPHEFLSQNEYVSKTCVPLQSVWKINATKKWFIQ